MSFDSKKGRPAIILLMAFSLTLSNWEPEDVKGATSGPFIQDAYWIYVGSLKSEVVGTGGCVGSYTYSESMQGRVTVKDVNESALVIENSKEGNISTYLEGCTCHGKGSRVFSPRGSFRYTQVGVDTIDRKALTYTSSMVGLDYRSSLIGMPAHDFVATTLKEGQLVPYCYLEQEINCSVKYGSIEFQGANIPVATLRYYGPITSWMPLAVKGRNVYWNGTADYEFNFERNTGLLLGHSISETIVISHSALNMSGCDITTTNTGNYTVTFTSWDITKPQQTPTSTPTAVPTQPQTGQHPGTAPPPSTVEPGPTDADRWLVPAALVIAASIAAVALVLRRMGTQQKT